MTEIKKEVKRLRRYRVYHRWLGIVLCIFIFISASTGILLSLKKEFKFLQPPTQKGTQKGLKKTLTLSVLVSKADSAFNTKRFEQIENRMDRMDIRPNKGIAKVLYENNWEVQIDLYNGNVLSIDKRYSDWIESIHDGSIINNYFKVISMNILGWGLIFMIITGVWLYYGPKKIRFYRNIKSNKQHLK